LGRSTLACNILILGKFDLCAGQGQPNEHLSSRQIFAPCSVALIGRSPRKVARCIIEPGRFAADP
jgi:hypothetical protein